MVTDIEIEKAIELIQLANIDGGASAGQQRLAEFIRACLNYSEKANIKELLYRMEISEICLLLRVAQSDDMLSRLVAKYNPFLLDEPATEDYIFWEE